MEEHETGNRLIFIHGAGNNSACWNEQVEFFKNAEALTLPGHRPLETFGNGGRKTIDGYAAWLNDWIISEGTVEHKTSKVVLVGHSMGSAIALVYALTYPDKLAGLVLAGGGANLKVNTSLLEALQNDFPTAVEFVVTHSFSSLAPEELRTSLRETWHDIPREVTLDDFLACNQYDVSGELNRLKNIPVLVITGAADVMTPPRLATRLAEGIPGAKLEFLDAAGHMLMQEKPQEFNRAIDQFLGSLPG